MTFIPEQSRAPFQTTQWTIMEVLREAEHDCRDEVLELLTARYWPPIYSWLRRFGLDREQACDLTQSFFLQVIFGRRLFELADVEQGKFRTLVRTALRHFVIDEHRRTKRGAHVVSLTEESIVQEESRLQSIHGDEDEVFERRWNLAMVSQALEIVESQYRQANQSKYWEAYEAWVIRPSITGNSRPDREKLAESLSFSNPSHLSVAVHNVKHRVRVILEQLATQDQIVTDDVSS